MFTAVQAAISYQSQTANVNVSSLDKWGWRSIWIGVIASCGTNVLTYVDQTLSRLAKGQLPTPTNDGNTDIIPNPNPVKQQPQPTVNKTL